MQYPSSLLLPAIMLVSSVGAAVVCVVLVWYGPVPECDEQPARAHRRRLVTRLAHAGALVCFVLATMLAAVGLGMRAREVPRIATGRELAGHDATLALARDATGVRAELAALDARLTHLESRTHAAGSGRGAIAPRHPADAGRITAERAAPDRATVARSRDAAPALAPGRRAPARAVPPNVEPVGPSAEPARPSSDRAGPARTSPPVADASPLAQEKPPAPPLAPSPASAALPETGTSGAPDRAERARRWLAGEAQEMRDTVRAEIADARERIDRVVAWFRNLRPDDADAPGRPPR